MEQWRRCRSPTANRPSFRPFHAVPSLARIGRTAALSGEQLERGERELRQLIASPPSGFPRPTLVGAHHRLGMIYERQGKKDRARAEYQAALAMDPANENAKKSLAALK